MPEARVDVNLEAIASIYGLPTWTVEYVQSEGVECPECGEQLSNFGQVIKHGHEFDVEEQVTEDE